ncbi:hypothetical protein HPB50_010775 [Hyalomma asiaticum]|uniref:Uncharacterized protein n=1 Tax=Hyalomma asiaticum TaxID=266040 RepID=A0ACB7T9L9_HYAAI|nr:hypothetical protein HPB50_010775 [Hyalomma asiaticum]
MPMDGQEDPNMMPMDGMPPEEPQNWMDYALDLNPYRKTLEVFLMLSMLTTFLGVAGYCILSYIIVEYFFASGGLLHAAEADMELCMDDACGEYGPSDQWPTKVMELHRIAKEAYRLCRASEGLHADLVGELYSSKSRGIGFVLSKVEQLHPVWAFYKPLVAGPKCYLFPPDMFVPAILYKNSDFKDEFSFAYLDHLKQGGVDDSPDVRKDVEFFFGMQQSMADLADDPKRRVFVPVERPFLVGDLKVASADVVGCRSKPYIWSSKKYYEGLKALVDGLKDTDLTLFLIMWVIQTFSIAGKENTPLARLHYRYGELLNNPPSAERRCIDYLEPMLRHFYLDHLRMSHVYIRSDLPRDSQTKVRFNFPEPCARDTDLTLFLIMWVIQTFSIAGKENTPLARLHYRYGELLNNPPSAERRCIDYLEPMLRHFYLDHLRMSHVYIRSDLPRDSQTKALQSMKRLVESLKIFLGHSALADLDVGKANMLLDAVKFELFYPGTLKDPGFSPDHMELALAAPASAGGGQRLQVFRSAVGPFVRIAPELDTKPFSIPVYGLKIIRELFKAIDYRAQWWVGTGSASEISYQKLEDCVKDLERIYKMYTDEVQISKKGAVDVRLPFFKTVHSTTQFFIALASEMCARTNVTVASLLNKSFGAKTAEQRMEMIASHMPQYTEHFGCKVSQRMHVSNRYAHCLFWNR